jgi:hypothetical protein
MGESKTPQYLRIDERNHVEEPLLDQLIELGWEIFELDGKRVWVQPNKIQDRRVRPYERPRNRPYDVSS